MPIVTLMRAVMRPRHDAGIITGAPRAGLITAVGHRYLAYDQFFGAARMLQFVNLERCGEIIPAKVIGISQFGHRCSLGSLEEKGDFSALISLSEEIDENGSQYFTDINFLFGDTVADKPPYPADRRGLKGRSIQISIFGPIPARGAPPSQLRFRYFCKAGTPFFRSVSVNLPRAFSRVNIVSASRHAPQAFG